MDMSIYDLVYEKEHPDIYNLLSKPTTIIDPMKTDLTVGKLFWQHSTELWFEQSEFHTILQTENQVYFSCHLKKGGLEYGDDVTYEPVQFMGYFSKSK